MPLNRRSRLSTFALLVLGVLAAVAGSRGQSISAVTFTSGSPARSGSYTIGYAFTVNRPTNVTELGLYDSNGDGFLDNSHQVGLWDGGGTLLGTVTVTSGSTLADGFRYVALGTPVTLSIGQTYTVAGLNGSDTYFYNTTDTAFAPGVSFVGTRYTAGNTLTYPTGSDGTANAYFGGSFRLAVPEPSTWAMALLGGAALLGFTVRRRRTTRRSVAGITGR